MTPRCITVGGWHRRVPEPCGLQSIAGFVQEPAVDPCLPPSLPAAAAWLEARGSLDGETAA